MPLAHAQRSGGPVLGVSHVHICPVAKKHPHAFGVTHGAVQGVSTGVAGVCVGLVLQQHCHLTPVAAHIRANKGLTLGLGLDEHLQTLDFPPVPRTLVHRVHMNRQYGVQRVLPGLALGVDICACLQTHLDGTQMTRAAGRQQHAGKVGVQHVRPFEAAHVAPVQVCKPPLQEQRQAQRAASLAVAVAVVVFADHPQHCAKRSSLCCACELEQMPPQNPPTQQR
jgi:hypothetical protein